jgi:hypothetical protein
MHHVLAESHVSLLVLRSKVKVKAVFSQKSHEIERSKHLRNFGGQNVKNAARVNKERWDVLDKRIKDFRRGAKASGAGQNVRPQSR